MLTLLILAALAACGDDVGPVDGGPDAEPDTAVASGPMIPWLAEGTPPVDLLPCPGGWREVTGGRVVECDPYPEGGPAACAAGEAHFPGEPACRSVGPACPAGEFADGLPTDGTVIFVDDDAAAGGDGSAGTPYAGLSGVSWASLAPGRTVALAKGSYDGTLPLRPGVRVIGACARDTILTGLDAPVLAVVSATGAGEAASISNLSITDAPQTAIRVEQGRGLVAEGVIVEGAPEYAVFAIGVGTTLILEGSVIRDTVLGDMGFGFGLGVGVGSHVEGRRLVLAGNRVAAITIGGEGAVLSLEDTVLIDTQPDALREFGRGVDVASGGRLEATRVAVLNNRDVALNVADPGTTASLTDVVIRGTMPRERDDNEGRGLNVELGAQVDATRVVVADNHSVGVYASGADTEVTLADLVIRGTQPTASTEAYGRGIDVVIDAHLAAERVLVESNHDIGINAMLGATVVLMDVAVLDTRFDGVGRFGRSLSVLEGARLDGSRILLRDAYELGLSAVADAVVIMDDVVVQNVETIGCARPECLELPLGYAVAALSSEMRLTRFAVERAATCGIFLADLTTVGPVDPTALDLQSGVVSSSEIGACLQVDGYDVNRLQNDVEYRDNGVNLDTTTLPVPDPSSAILR